MEDLQAWVDLVALMASQHQPQMVYFALYFILFLFSFFIYLKILFYIITKIYTNFIAAEPKPEGEGAPPPPPGAGGPPPPPPPMPGKKGKAGISFLPSPL